MAVMSDFAQICRGEGVLMTCAGPAIAPILVPWRSTFPGYTHEFLSQILVANRKSVTLAAQSMQAAGLISYHRGAIQVVDRAGPEKASYECYAIVKERFDAFLTPPSTAVQSHSKGEARTVPIRRQ
jgi:hypothetical protein